MPAGQPGCYAHVHMLVEQHPLLPLFRRDGNNRISFKANPNYWAGSPSLAGVEYLVIGDLSVAFQAYQNGEIDILSPDANDLPLIRADGEAQRLVLADAPFIVRAHSKNIYLIKPHVQGIEASTLDSGYPGMFTSLRNVTIAE